MMQCTEKLEQYLREEGVAFEAHQHRPAYTAQEVAESEHVPGNQVAKVVLVWADDQLAMMVLPASYHLDVAHVGTILGAEQVRLADEEELGAVFPDCEIGAMPAFGNLYDLPVYVDSALCDVGTIVMQAGTHTNTVRMAYADYARLVAPNVAAFTFHN